MRLVEVLPFIVPTNLYNRIRGSNRGGNYGVKRLVRGKTAEIEEGNF